MKLHKELGDIFKEIISPGTLLKLAASVVIVSVLASTAGLLYGYVMFRDVSIWLIGSLLFAAFLAITPYVVLAALFVVARGLRMSIRLLYLLLLVLVLPGRRWSDKQEMMEFIIVFYQDYLAKRILKFEKS